MMRAKPNPGHHALAALAKKKADFLCLSQNIDSGFLLSSHIGPPMPACKSTTPFF